MKVNWVQVMQAVVSPLGKQKTWLCRQIYLSYPRTIQFFGALIPFCWCYFMSGLKRLKTKTGELTDNYSNPYLVCCHQPAFCFGYFSKIWVACQPFIGIIHSRIVKFPFIYFLWYCSGLHIIYLIYTQYISSSFYSCSSSFFISFLTPFFSLTIYVIWFILFQLNPLGVLAPCAHTPSSTGVEDDLVCNLKLTHLDQMWLKYLLKMNFDL